MLVCLLDYANTSDPSLFDRADLLYTTIIIKSTLRLLENVIKRNYRRSRTDVYKTNTRSFISSVSRLNGTSETMSLAERIKLFIHIRNLGKSETWLSDYLMLANFHNAPGSYKLEYNTITS